LRQGRGQAPRRKGRGFATGPSSSLPLPPRAQPPPPRRRGLFTNSEISRFAGISHGRGTTQASPDQIVERCRPENHDRCGKDPQFVGRASTRTTYETAGYGLDFPEKTCNGLYALSTRPQLPTFSDPMCIQVWAALMTLDVPLQYEVLRELATRFSSATVAAIRPEEKIRKAVADLHTATDIYGHSPSVKEYRALQERFPELELAPDATIRRSLAGGWSDCLRVALLDAVSDGDFARPTGISDKFPDEAIHAAVRDCAADLGHVPSMPEYFQWVRRPDVVGRPGRRPRSYHPFERLGGFRHVLVAAALVGEGEERIGAHGRRIALC
jgi:hypothetical protein